MVNSDSHWVSGLIQQNIKKDKKKNAEIRIRSTFYVEGWSIMNYIFNGGYFFKLDPYYGKCYLLLKNYMFSGC